jgi:hypothetical protein
VGRRMAAARQGNGGVASAAGGDGGATLEVDGDDRHVM